VEADVLTRAAGFEVEGDGGSWVQGCCRVSSDSRIGRKYLLFSMFSAGAAKATVAVAAQTRRESFMLNTDVENESRLVVWKDRIPWVDYGLQMCGGRMWGEEVLLKKVEGPYMVRPVEEPWEKLDSGTERSGRGFSMTRLRSRCYPGGPGLGTL
jgi:hypothetical protein